MNRKKLFWGFFFILAAVYAIVGRLGILPDIGLPRILLTVFLIWILTEGARRVNFYKILFPLAFLAILYDEPLGITALTPWTVLLAALLGSIGLSIIFQGSRRKTAPALLSESKGFGSGIGSGQCTGEHIRCENTFGTAIRYIQSGNFRSADLENNFGTLSVYFDNAVIDSGSAYITAENNFGTLNLYIPREWQIQNNLDRAFGAVSESGTYAADGSAILYIDGSANFGTINIHYV